MGFKSKTYNLSSLDGVYDVKIGDAEPSARKQRDASKTGKASKTPDSQQYDDARQRAKDYGYDPKAGLPNGYFI